MCLVALLYLYLYCLCCVVAGCYLVFADYIVGGWVPYYCLLCFVWSGCFGLRCTFGLLVALDLLSW